MEVVNVKISDLKSCKYNPRKWNEEQITGLKASILEFGLIDPLIVNSNKKRFNIVIGGHFRLCVAKKLELKEVPVTYVDLDIKKEKALNVALNNRHIQGDFTADLLPLLEEIEINTPDLFVELNLEPLKLDINTNLLVEEEKTKEELGNGEEWVKFQLGTIKGVVHGDVAVLFYSLFDRLSKDEIVGSKEITPIMECIIANMAATPDESLR